MTLLSDAIRAAQRQQQTSAQRAEVIPVVRDKPHKDPKPTRAPKSAETRSQQPDQSMSKVRPQAICASAAMINRLNRNRNP